jgi:hypothetical protein
MKSIKVLIIFLFVCTSALGQKKLKHGNWHTFVQPVLDSIYGETKKVYLYSYFRIPKEQSLSIVSYVDRHFSSVSCDWNQLWIIANNNSLIDFDWNGGFSSSKKDRLIQSKRFKNEKIEVISVSRLIFLSRNEYMIAITTYCPGLCSSTKIYFINFDLKTEKVKIISSFNTGVS